MISNTLDGGILLVQFPGEFTYDAEARASLATVLDGGEGPILVDFTKTIAATQDLKYVLVAVGRSKRARAVVLSLDQNREAAALEGPKFVVPFKIGDPYNGNSAALFRSMDEALVNLDAWNVRPETRTRSSSGPLLPVPNCPCCGKPMVPNWSCPQGGTQE